MGSWFSSRSNKRAIAETPLPQRRQRLNEVIKLTQLPEAAKTRIWKFVSDPQRAGAANATSIGVQRDIAAACLQPNDARLKSAA